MNAIEAGRICRDSGFDWGKGCWWGPEDLRKTWIVETDRLSKRDLRDCIPNLTKGATRGVIVEWAREMKGIKNLTIASCAVPGFPSARNGWNVFNAGYYCHFESETEFECYAKLCQSVKQEQL